MQTKETGISIEVRSRIKAYLQIVTKVSPTEEMVDRFIASYGILEPLVVSLKASRGERIHAAKRHHEKAVAS